MTDFENVERFDIVAIDCETTQKHYYFNGDYVKYEDYESLLFAYKSLLHNTNKILSTKKWIKDY